jgi:flagellar biosynthesis anti-sigma factor FlgM
MKIDTNRLTPDADATKSTEATKKAVERVVTKTGERPAAPGTDKVELSSDAQLLAAALKATNDTGSVRLDVVEAVRRKLLAGDVGNDSGRLADRMIDELLKR